MLEDGRVMEQLAPNFSIQVPGGIHALSERSRRVLDSLDGPRLPACAGGRQRRQGRRDGWYPKGNEPKPWSKRSKRKLAGYDQI